MFVFTPKISDDLFLVIDLVFSDFAVFTVIKCHIRPFLHKKNNYFRKEFLHKTIFFTLFILLRTSDNTASLNTGGTNAWAVPPPQILGGPSPQSPAPRLTAKEKDHWIFP